MLQAIWETLRASHWTVENQACSHLLEQGFGDASVPRPLQGRMGALGEDQNCTPREPSIISIDMTTVLLALHLVDDKN